MIPENVNSIFYNAVHRNAKLHMYHDDEWKDLSTQPPYFDNPPGSGENVVRRGWVFGQFGAMTQAAWTPLHFECTSANELFAGGYWRPNGSSTVEGPKNYTYWKERADAESANTVLEKYIHPAGMLALAGQGRKGTDAFSARYLFPFFCETNAHPGYLNPSNPVRHAEYRQYPSGEPWLLTDPSIQFFLQPSSSQARRYDDFIPPGLSQAFCGWALSPGSHIPYVMRDAPMKNMSTVKNELDDETFFYGYSFMSPCYHEPNRTDHTYAGGHRILSLTRWRKSLTGNTPSGTQTWPVGGYPVEYFGASNARNEFLNSDWPQSWIGGFEVVSNQEEGWDAIVVLNNYIESSDGTSFNMSWRLSVVTVMHSDIEARLTGQTEAPLYVNHRVTLIASPNSGFNVGHTQSVLQGAMLIPPRPDIKNNYGHGLYVSYTEAETNDAEDVYGTTEFRQRGAIINLRKDGSGTSTLVNQTPLGHPGDPDQVNTSGHRFRSILSRTIIKPTDQSGLGGVLTRHPMQPANSYTPWNRPLFDTYQQYTPGRLQIQWVLSASQPPETEWADIGGWGDYALIGRFVWAQYPANDYRPRYSYAGPGDPNGNFPQLNLPVMMSAPWVYGAGVMNYSWHKCLFPGEQSRVVLFKDERNDDPIESWTFAMMGLQRLNKQQAEIGWNNSDHRASARDSITFFNMEVPPYGADGVTYNE